MGDLVACFVVGISADISEMLFAVPYWVDPCKGGMGAVLCIGCNPVFALEVGDIGEYND